MNTRYSQGLDTVSAEIGSLKANVENIKTQNEDQKKVLADIQRKVTELSNVDSRLKHMEEIGKDYLALKAKATTIGGAFAILFTFVGVVVSSVLENLVRKFL